MATQKIKKTGDGVELKLVETSDIVGTLGQSKKTSQWCVCFALETEDGHNRALKKLKKKNCDLVVLNDASAIDSTENQVDIIGVAGTTIKSAKGPKPDVAKAIMKVIQDQLIDRS